MFEAFKSALLKHMIKYMDFLNERLKTNKVIQCYNLIWDSYIAFLKLLSKRIFTYLVLILLLRTVIMSLLMI